MKRRNRNFKNPMILFAAGFFLGLFVKFLPFFLVLMLLVFAAGLISSCFSR